MTAGEQRLSELTLLQARKAARAVAAAPQEGPVLHVRLAGNATTDFALEVLQLGLAQQGVRAQVSAAEFDGWATDDPDPVPDVWLLWLSTAGATRGGAYAPGLRLPDVLQAVQRVRSRGARPVVVLPELSAAERDPFGAVAVWRRRLVAELTDALAPLGVPALSLDHLVADAGLSAWSSSRYWEAARLPCHPERLPAVVEEMSATVARTLLPRVRAVAVDLDDTLWGGLVGEVGPEGLALDPFGSGRAFLEMQTLLRQAKDAGVPLAVVSKNDPDQALRPFTERPEMVLRREDFVAFDAGWGAKHLAIEEFARLVNVGVDAVCFLDDSPFERDQAAANLPGLIVPDLPAEPALRVPALLRERLFLRPVVTEEDRLRSAFVKRTAEQDAPSGDGDYLAGLDMVLRPRRVASGGLDRAVELVGKTNQFNLTLGRTGRTRLAALAASDDSYVYTFSLSDRLGPAGDICVVVAALDGGELRVEEWVLSCRVFSRGVEWAVLQHLLAWAEARALRLVLPWVAGPRNRMVHDLLTPLGLDATPVEEPPGVIFRGMPKVLPDHVVRLEGDL